MKTRLPLILNFLLVIVALATLMFGSYMLVNLRNSLLELRQEDPDLEFVLIKDITLNVNRLEERMIAYRYQPSQTPFQEMDSIYLENRMLLDSLKTINKDDAFLRISADSIHSLFDEYVSSLKAYATLNRDPDISFNQVENIVNRELENDSLPPSTSTTLQIDTTYTEPEEEEKTGFFKRLFGAKQEEQQPEPNIKIDTTLIRTTVENRRKPDLTAILDSLENEFLSRRAIFNQSELDLSRQITQIQYSIYEYLSFIESREITKSQIETIEAQTRLADTRRQVSNFAFIIGIIILMTLAGMFIFLQQNRKFQKMLILAREKAEDYATSKQLFLAKMSHEIRTPMNAILGFTEQLGNTKLSPRQKEYLEIINHSSDHLLHLLNDILELSRFQNNSIKLEHHHFDLKKLIEDTMIMVKRTAEEKNLVLTTDLTNIKIDPVYSDPYRIKQILLNLLSNAIKYTEKGWVRLTVQSYERSELSPQLKIIVEDSGIGISPEEQERIFSVFEQVHHKDISSGAGLGLSIIKYLINLFEGEVKVESEEGEGSRFEVAIPVGKGEISMIEDHSIKENGRTFHGIKVLMADDEVFNRKLFRQIANKHKFELKMAKDGREAVELLQSIQFDLVFLDQKMPQMSGIEVAQKIREMNENPPFLVAISATEVEDKELFDRILMKPYRDQQIISILETFSSSNEFSVDSLLELGGQDFVNQMLSDFLVTTENGLNELEQVGDAHDQANLLHKLKGPARHLDIASFAGRLGNLERAARQGDQIGTRDIESLKEIFKTIESDIKIYLKDNHE